MILELRNIKAEYKDGFVALDDINFKVKDKAFLVVLGESGSGKTTLFKVITGLLDPIEGSVFINDADVTNVMTASRDVTMTFQNVALYPHMTIYQNVLTSLNGFKMSENEKDQRTKEILSAFGLSKYINFKPRHLSEGQKQRVAICKSLIREPALFLLDEPFSNLDAPQQRKIKAELKKMFEMYNSSFVFISHDAKDAEMLSTEVLILDKGKVIQHGSFHQIKQNPKSFKVFQLINNGEINDYEAQVKDGVMHAGGFSLPCQKKSGKYRLGFTYKDVFLSDNGPIQATVLSTKILPGCYKIDALLKDGSIISCVTSNEIDEIKEKDVVRFDVPLDKQFLFKL